MLNIEQIIEMLADAYHDAAIARADMRSATEALESIRSALIQVDNPFGAWDGIDANTGKSVGSPLEPVLNGLRKVFLQRLLESETARLLEAFERDTETGCRTWLRSYSEALTQGRKLFALKMCDAPLPFPSSQEPPVSELRRNAQLALHGRWAETYPLYEKLAELEFLPPPMRAALLSIETNICLYYLLQPRKSNDLLERAEKLAPLSAEVMGARGNYWLQQNDVDKARACFQEAVRVNPSLADGYTGLGECFERANEPTAAEAQYRLAISNAGAWTAGYSSLLRLYTLPELFTARKGEIAQLVSCIVAVEPLDGYNAHLTAGYAYQHNGFADDAHTWYRKAIEMDTERLDAYSAEGYLYLESDRFEEAERSFRQAIGVAPEAMDGYWAMAALTEEREDWNGTIQWCNESLNRRPEWTGTIRSRIGAIYRRQGRLDEAQSELFQSLNFEPDNPDALNGLYDIADEYCKRLDNPQQAMQLYIKLRELYGDPFEPEFQNAVATLTYYTGDYKSAGDQYRTAISLAPERAIFYYNLSFALEQLSRTGSGGGSEQLNEAIGALNSALERSTDADRAEYQRRLDELEQQRQFIRKYGTKALRFIPSIEPVRFLVADVLKQLVVDASPKSATPNLLELGSAMIERIRLRYGLTAPAFNFYDLPDPGAEHGAYTIEVKEQPLEVGTVQLGCRFAQGSKAVIEASGISGITPATQSAQINGLWIDKTQWPNAESNGVTLWSEVEYLYRRLEAVLEQNLASFVNYQQTVNLLAPVSAEACIRVLGSIDKTMTLALVLKKLLAAGRPITQLEQICQQFNSLFESGASADTIADKIASALELHNSAPFGAAV